MITFGGVNYDFCAILIIQNSFCDIRENTPKSYGMRLSNPPSPPQLYDFFSERPPLGDNIHIIDHFHPLPENKWIWQLVCIYIKHFGFGPTSSSFQIHILSVSKIVSVSLFIVVSNSTYFSLFIHP